MTMCMHNSIWPQIPGVVSFLFLMYALLNSAFQYLMKKNYLLYYSATYE